MEVVWDKAAEADFITLLSYLEDNFGMKSARTFRQKVLAYTNSLAEHPKLGHSEPELEISGTIFRSLLIDKPCKLVYTLTPVHIFIIALWDTRRNPDSLRDETNRRFTKLQKIEFIDSNKLT